MFFGNLRRVLKKGDIKAYNKESLPIEKGDLLPILIAAFLVFFPVVLIFCGLLFLLTLIF